MKVLHFPTITDILFINIVTACQSLAAEKYWVWGEEIRRLSILPCDVPSFLLFFGLFLAFLYISYH